MSRQYSEEEALKIVKSELEKMSCEEIRDLIRKEYKKDSDSRNTDFIDLCFSVLYFKQSEKNFVVYKKRPKKLKPIKTLAFAATFILFMTAAVSVSAEFFDFDIPKEISALINGNVVTDFNLELKDTTADGYQLEDTEFAKIFKDYEIEPITFPEEFAKGNCEITYVEDLTDDEILLKNISVEFKYNDFNVSFAIGKYGNDFGLAGDMIDYEMLSAEIIKANGMDILVYECDKGCFIKYKDSETVYDIYLETDFETAKSIAQSVK